VDDVTMGIDLTPETAQRITAVGIDVGGRRKGFHACALRGVEIVAGPQRLADVARAVEWVVELAPAVVSLDSPRTCAPPGESSRDGERSLAREVCGIRWTPERARLAGNPYYEWIEHGLELYAALAAAGFDPGDLIEVFPTAAWTIWAGPRGKVPRSRWSAAALADLRLDGVPYRRLSQDDRDAIAAALVARLHAEGQTRAFGEIVIPDGGRPGARRRARTSPARPAAGPGRPAPARPG
jgi:predicted nuclease with RNAse H fold